MWMERVARGDDVERIVGDCLLKIFAAFKYFVVIIFKSTIIVLLTNSITIITNLSQFCSTHINFITTFCNTHQFYHNFLQSTWISSYWILFPTEIYMFQLECIGRVSTWDPMPIATQTLSEDGLVGNDGYHRFSWHTFIANRLVSTRFYTTLFLLFLG